MCASEGGSWTGRRAAPGYRRACACELPARSRGYMQRGSQDMAPSANLSFPGPAPPSARPHLLLLLLLVRRLLAAVLGGQLAGGSVLVR